MTVTSGQLSIHLDLSRIKRVDDMQVFSVDPSNRANISDSGLKLSNRELLWNKPYVLELSKMSVVYCLAVDHTDCGGFRILSSFGLTPNLKRRT